jgi:small subunit ribosomal protein S17
MRRHLVGLVTADKLDKTRRVEVPRTYRHPKYGKIVKARTICHMHDEKNESKTGDTVEIEECRPQSRLKRWSLVKIVKKASAAVGVTVVEPAAAEAATK